SPRAGSRCRSTAATPGRAWKMAWRTRSPMAWAARRGRSGSTSAWTSTCRDRPTQRALTECTASTPSTDAAAPSTSSITSGATRAASRQAIRPDSSRPASGSAAGRPAQAPAIPAAAARLASPSTREWRPSASSGTELIRRPTRSLYWATASLPTTPTKAAASAQPGLRSGGTPPVSVASDSAAAITAEAAMASTTSTPATSSALANPKVWPRSGWRRPTRKATHRVTVVNTSPRLWRPSASRATEPLAATKANWTAAVSPSPGGGGFAALSPSSSPAAEPASGTGAWLCRWPCPWSWLPPTAPSLRPRHRRSPTCSGAPAPTGWDRRRQGPTAEATHTRAGGATIVKGKPRRPWMPVPSVEKNGLGANAGPPTIWRCWMEARARGEAPDRNLALELVRVTEAAAMAGARKMGFGDKEAVDQAAVDAMRHVLGSVPMTGVVVIGEGEKDNAPMLYNGEEIGDGSPPEVHVAVDPVDGTTLTAKSMPNAISVVALSDRGTMFDPGPCVYMEKLVVGPEAADAVDFEAPLALNLRLVAKAKGAHVGDLTVCILDRPRHEELIAQIRQAGARVKLITDGDVAGAIMAVREGTGVDMLVGVGGTPEAVIAACALKCLDGAMFGRLWPRNDEERRAALDAGYDLDKVLDIDDLVRGDNVFFAATGVTDGGLLRAARFDRLGALTQSLAMRSKSGTSRQIDARHQLSKLSRYASIDYG